MKFHDLVFDEREDAWYLGVPEDGSGKTVDTRAFMRGKPFRKAFVPRFPIVDEGEHLDFTFTAFGFFVVSGAAAKSLREWCNGDIQLVPAVTSGGDEIFILNTLNVIDCIDHRCVDSYYPDDFYDAHRAGKPRMIIQLAIDSELAGSHSIFRLKGWAIPTIVCEDLFNRMVAAQFSGFTSLPIQDSRRLLQG